MLPNANSAGIEVIFDPESNEIVSGVSAANVINNYFANIGDKLAEKLPASKTDFWPKRVTTEFLWDLVITPFHILYYSKDFCKSKSSRISGISSRIPLDFFTVKPDIMADIFNKCLVSGIYPARWKHSIMVPIPKNNNPLYLNNLRPISLIPLPGKLFEKIIHSRLSGYFETNELLCKEQGGFRKGMDTSHTIYDLVNY